MKKPIQGALVLAALASLWLLRQTSVSAPAAPPAAGAVEPAPAPAQGVPPAPASVPRLARDPFRYADPTHGLEVAAPGPTAEPLVPDAPAPRATPAPVRLLGFVRQGASLKAVLSVFGTLVVAEAGQNAEGYRVVSVDEDAGVTLRSRDGAELRLRQGPGS